MNLPGAVRKLIADDATAFALVGNRVYPIFLPDNATYPAVVVRMSANNPANTKSNPSKTDNVMMDIDIVSGDYQQCCEVFEAVRSAIDGYRGDVVFLGDTIAVDGIEYKESSQAFLDVQDGTGQMRLYMHNDIYGIRIKRDGLTGTPGNNPGALEYYDSDDDAITAGLAVGREYLLDGTNIYGMPKGVRKVIQA